MVPKDLIKYTDYESNLQTSMNDVTLFNGDHRIIQIGTKSVRVLFERQKSKRLKPQDVTYNGQVIPSSSPLTLLSPSDLTFLKINFIFSSTYGSSTFRSFVDYDAPAICVASPNVQRSWERVQTHFISRGLSIPSFIHNRKWQPAYLPPIHDRNLYLAKRWYRRAMQHNRGVQDYIYNHTHNKRKNLTRN